MPDSAVAHLTSLREETWSLRGLLAVGVLPFSLLFPSLDLSFQAKLLAIAGTELVWWLVWLVKSGRLVLPSGSRKVVAFAFRVDREGLRNYERILASLRRTLLEAKIPIGVVRVDPAVIRCRQDAERYVQRQRVEGVFWGESRYGTEDGEKKLKFQLSLTTQVIQIRRELFDGYDELRRLPAVAVDVNLVEVHEFLWEESRHAPENFGLIFAAGMVSRFFDPRTARRDFQEFLRKSARGHRWKLLRTRADGELGALRKKGG